jgi:hypothetical protein
MVMTLRASGNVGIGTAAPAQQLTIIPPGTPSAPNAIALGESSNNAQYRLLMGLYYDGNWKSGIQSTTASTTGPLILNPSGGNVGIALGTTQPAYALHVAGDCNLSAGSVYRINGVPISGSGGISTQNTNPGTALGSVYQNTTGKPVFHTVSVSMNSSSGNLIATTDSSSSPSTPVASTSNFSSGFTNMSISFWVLPGNYYKVALAVAGGTLQYWTQWY